MFNFVSRYRVPIYVGFILIGMFYLAFQPLDWGVMDDSSWIAQFQQTGLPSVADHMAEFFRADRSWGLFRPVYGLYLYVIYGVLGFQWGMPPAWLYSILFGFYFLLALGFGFLESDQTKRWLSILFWFSFFPGLSLVAHISLQEKLALFFMLLSLWSLRIFQTQWLRWTLATTSLSLAVMSKSTAIAFVPVLLGAVFAEKNKKREIFGALCLVILILFSTILMFRSPSGYTSRYAFEWAAFKKFFINSGAWGFIHTFLLIGTLGSFFSVGIKKVPLQSWGWFISFVALLVIMIPWGIHGYYWSIFLPVSAWAFATIASAVFSKIPNIKSPLWAALLLCATAGILERLPRQMSKVVDTGRINSWMVNSARKDDRFVLAWPCQEAAVALPLATKRAREQFHTSSQFRKNSEVWEDAKWFITNSWTCPRFSGEIQDNLKLKYDFRNWKIWEKKSNS